MNFVTKSWIFEIFCLNRKFLVFNLVDRNLKMRYRRSILGLFWTLIVPIGLASIYFLIFKVIFKVQLDYYPALIIVGILHWSFFSQTLSEGMEAVLANFHLIKKVPLPIFVFPFVSSLTNLVTLAFAIPVMIGAAIFCHAPINLSLIALPILSLLLFVISYSIGIIFSVFLVFFRDLRPLVSLLLQIWIYATPVFYSPEMIPTKYKGILMLNPIAHIFAGFHTIIGGKWPDLCNVGASTSWAIGLLTIAILVQRKFGTLAVERM